MRTSEANAVPLRWRIGKYRQVNGLGGVSVIGLVTPMSIAGHYGQPWSETQESLQNRRKGQGEEISL